jgi:hypothetical protein
MLKALGTSRSAALTPVSATVLDLTAVALASGSYGTASVLIDWFTIPPDAPQTKVPTSFEQALANHPYADNRPVCAHVPEYVRPEYYQIAVLLIAARVRQRQKTMAAGLKAQVRSYAFSLPDGLARCKLVCECIGPVVALADDEKRAWSDELAQFI